MNSKKQLNYRRNKEEAELFPKVWHKSLGDEEVFSFVTYCLPMSEIIYEILSRYIDENKKFELRLSSRYLNKTKNIFPGFYSDRERIIVLLNRFKRDDRNWDELFYWIGFLSKKKGHPYMHFFLGILFLDQYIQKMDQEIWIQKSISQLSKALRHIKHTECRKALGALLAFAHYLDNDFDTSMKIVKEAA